VNPRAITSFIVPAISAVIVAGCAGGRASYFPGDPLLAGAKAKDFGVFQAVLPSGYKRSEARLTGSMTAMFHQPLFGGGEAAISVESYTDGSVDRAAFVQNLIRDVDAPKPSKHEVGGKEFPVYHDLEFVSYGRRIGPDDLFSGSLGTWIKPPRLSWFEGRRFPPGGDAYRLYRCKKRGAWGVLGDYRRALKKKGEVDKFRMKMRNTRDGKLLSPCFGKTVLMAISDSEPVPKIPKPSMYRLRIMARDEWHHGASRNVDRECVHIRDIPGGFMVLRFRAPRAHFKSEHERFLTFLGSFQASPSP